MIKFIQEELDKWHKTVEERAIAKVKKGIKNKASILSIALMPFAHQTRIAYRVYKEGIPVYDDTVIKGKLNVVRDVEDIMDTVTRRCNKYDIVGIAAPGGIKDGCYVDLDKTMIDPQLNFKKLLENKYNVPVIIYNNLNAAVLGYYAQQDKYENIVFVSLPRGYLISGQGIVINGKLITGTHNMAGEVKYILYSILKKEEWQQHLCFDIEKLLEYLELTVRIGISTVDPELICIRSEILPDMKKVKDKLMELIPEEYLPALVHIKETEMQEYVLLGQMILSLEELEKK